MLKIAVIGYGYWGPNLSRNFYQNPRTELAFVCDSDESRLRKAAALYPGLKVTTDFGQILADKTVDAVAIATPVSTHYELSRRALEAGKHVLVEKPFTHSVAHAEELVALARARNRVCMVDHVFLFTSAVRKIKELYRSGELGGLRYFDSTRINLGLFQHDVNVVWDLGAHDVSIVDYLIGQVPESVQATGISHVGNNVENIAYVTLYYPGGLIAHFHVNWLSPVKVRTILIGGEKKMVVFDDNQTSEKIKIYDSGIEVHQSSDRDSIYKTLIQYRTGDMHAPKLDQCEALTELVNHFAACVLDGEKPINDAESGLRVVRILEAAEKSVKNGGAVVRP